MGKIILYKLNGDKNKILELTLENIKNINGMKVKCHLKDNTDKVGFADVYRTNDKDGFDNEIHDYINLWTYDLLDEETHKLVGTDNNRYNQTTIKIFIDDIVEIEAILHSNPRWGTMLTNKFCFFKNDNKEKLEIPDFLKKRGFDNEQ